MNDSKDINWAREMVREHIEAIDPLMNQLMGLARQMEAGEAVPARTIGRGMRLWGEYVHDMHVPRMLRLVEERELSGATAMCKQFVSRLGRRNVRFQSRVEELTSLLQKYQDGDVSAGPRLGRSLRLELESDRMWITYEESHPLGCLLFRSERMNQARLDKEFGHDQMRFRWMEGEISEFLKGSGEHLPTAPVEGIA